MSYGRHIVFLMESRIPLRSTKQKKPFETKSIEENSSTKKVSRTTTETTGSSAIRLKGQMKWIQNWNMIVFLCHPMFVSLFSLFSNEFLFAFVV